MSRYRRATHIAARQARLQLLISQVFRFGVVGTVGFAVDGGVLTFLSQCIGWDVYLSRGASFASATMVTWALNRIVTFRMAAGSRRRGRAREYASYFLIQSIGALINLAIFAGLIWRFPAIKGSPLIPLAAGSAVALFFNFFAARRFVFQARPAF